MNDIPKLRAASLSTKHRRMVAIWLTFSLTACIAVLTLFPLDAPQTIPGNDKIHHVLAFVALTLPCAAFYPKALLRVMMTAVAYGALIEVIQPYVGRSGDLADFFADVVGVGIGASIGLLLNMMCKSSANRRPLRG